MKKCVTCENLREEDEYAWRYKLRRIKWNTCKECQTAQRANWYQRNKEEHKKTAKKYKHAAKKVAREYIWNHLSNHPCIDYGNSDPQVLEFDHIRGKKNKTISQLAGEGYSTEAINKELAKYVVRCANCHRIKTAKERGWVRG